MNGELLKRLREEKGVTQRIVAAATGLTEATLSTIELGKNKNTTTDTLKAIAKYYEIDPSTLLDED